MLKNTPPYRLALRATWLGIFVNAILGATKLFAGVFGGSTALIADALETLSDIGTSIVLIIALKIAQKPADANHPYGHGKAESLGSVLVAMSLITVAVLIIIGASRQLFYEDFKVPSMIALWAAILSIGAKEALYQYKVRLARKLNSSSLLADAWNHRADALSSIATVAAISIIMIGGQKWAWVDPLVAILVGLIIAYMGIKTFLETSKELMDEQQTPEFIEMIKETAASQKGILKVEKIRVRKSGLTYFIELHLEVDPLMPVVESHQLGHDVQDLLMKKMEGIGGVLVHIEPYRPGHLPVQEF